MEHARCKCIHDANGERQGRHPECPFHGFTSETPKLAWELSVSDRQFLKVNRISPLDMNDIQQVRQADEHRFKRE